MRSFGLLGVFLASLVCACAGQPRPIGQDASITRGAALAEQNCSSCHAVAGEDESGFPGAPPFRHLSHRYSIWNLEEALGEGIVVGHPAMPPFQFAPDELTDLLAYVESIQEAP